MQEELLEQLKAKYNKVYKEEKVAEIVNRYQGLVNAYVRTMERVDEENLGSRENSKIVKTKLNSLNRIKNSIDDISKVIYSAIEKNTDKEIDLASSKRKQKKSTSLNKDLTELASLEKELNRAELKKENEDLTVREEKKVDKLIEKKEKKIDKLMAKMVKNTIKSKSKRIAAKDVWQYNVQRGILKIPGIGLNKVKNIVLNIVENRKSTENDISDILNQPINMNFGTPILARGAFSGSYNPQPMERTPDPVTPDPVTPDPVTSVPRPVTPNPVTPDPVTPDPVTPDPVTPAPVTPDPVTPDPVTPDPVTPDPVTPDPVTPDPVTPEPVTPEPVTSDIIKAGQRKEPNEELSAADREIEELKAAIAKEKEQQEKKSNANEAMKRSIESAAVLYAERKRQEEKTRVEKELATKQEEIAKLKAQKEELSNQTNELDNKNQELANVFKGMRNAASQGDYGSAVEISKPVTDMSKLTQADRDSILADFNKAGFSMNPNAIDSNQSSKGR